MENAPAISMLFMNFAPGVESETKQRYQQWATEAYAPIMRKIAGVTGCDTYSFIRKNPEYPEFGSLTHIESMRVLENVRNSPETLAVANDITSWAKRGVREGIWSATYELVKDFRIGAASTGGRPDTKIENAPIIHLEAYRMTQEEQEKYNKWFNENGRVFIPLFMRNCGLKGYIYLKYASSSPPYQYRETKYPPYLSLLYFEDLKEFEHFQESSEQISFQSSLRNVFLLGLNYKWYVQYQLLRSIGR